MILVLAGLAGIAGLYFMTTNSGSDSSNEESSSEETKKADILYGIRDVSPDLQGGSYKRDYDIYFEAARNEFGVPFALLKAHAIAESSLNPNAFADENPTKRADRIGWASRGLMQILWSPLEPKSGDAGVNKNRWVKYGYPAESLGIDGIRQFEPGINTRIAAQLIRDNLKASSGNLRDAINMYNTGKKESVFPAPNKYVDKVLGYYNKLIGVN